MQQSDNYQLNLPEGTDNVKRQDLVDNFKKIDVVMHGHDTQLSDLTYQTAGGAATAITLTIKGTLVTGYPITFIAASNNSGAATTINGKQLYKPGTTTAPNLISGKAYTVWYNAPSDCFFIKASAEGDAIAANVLAGKKFSNDNDTGLIGTLDLSNLISANIKSGVTINGVSGKSSVVDTADANAVAGQILSGQTAYVNGSKITGTITSKTAATYNPSTSAQTIAAGQYLSGAQTINPVTGTANTGHVLSGYTFASGNGIGLTGTIPSKAAATITPGTTDQTIAANQFLSGIQTIKGDANLASANIANGISVFGVTGSAPRFASGTIAYTNGTANTITLPFTPRAVRLVLVTTGYTYTYMWGSGAYNNYFYYVTTSNGTAISSCNCSGNIITVGSNLITGTLTYYAWE